MDDEAVQEKLAAALEDAGVGVWLERTLLADALLPVVREIAAAELRSAADAYDEGDGGFLACAFFRARAEEMDPRAEEDYRAAARVRLRHPPCPHPQHWPDGCAEVALAEEDA